MVDPRRMFLVMLLSLLTACVAKEVLVPKGAVVPAGVDLSGQWQLQDSNDGIARALRASRTSGSAVRVFLELGESLKVTQTDAGVFVSFDRSIVEEYRFGENREVSVGPISASRVSGWETGGYVIETLHEDGDKLIETYRLDNSGNSLLRQIVLIVKREERFNATQRYARR